MTLQQAIAICGMTRFRHEYNLGVLTMLGEADLCITHRLAAESVDWQRMRIAQHESRADTEPLLNGEELRRARELLHRAQTQEDESWRAIEVFIRQARIVAGAALAALPA